MYESLSAEITTVNKAEPDHLTELLFNSEEHVYNVLHVYMYIY